MSGILIEVYTPAYKLVLAKEFPPVLAGQTVKLELLDDWGEPLSRGLYHVAVTTKKNRKIATLVILR
jgi:hypothetical protein